MSNPAKSSGRLAKALMDEYPTAGNLTLAKRLYQQFPEHFETVEHARNVVRYYRGAIGERGRQKLADLTHVKDLDKALRDKFSLPCPATTPRPPYIIPKVNDRILVFGDTHFPYQSNVAILKAIEYGLHKEVNCIILNGDLIDLYQDSKFTKDGRKPNIEYDIEMGYEFLLNLRATFPNVLIVWKFGNHEKRWDSYFKTNAPLHYMVGTMNLDDVIPVNEMNIIVVKDERRIVCGDLNILHGHEYNGGAGNVNPARNIFLKARSNTLINHFHRTSSHMGNTLNGGQIRTYSLGSMCAPQDYSPYGDQDCSFGYIVVIDGISWVQVREITA
jgi:predicted phosphodiesterase